MWDADAVIVVGAADDEIFMMSHGEDEEEGFNANDTPLSVLIAGLDGEFLFAHLNDEMQGEGFVFARISLQQVSTDEDGRIVNGDVNLESENVHWPAVLADRNVIQILAQHDWGIKATLKDGEAWNLQLLRHAHATSNGSQALPRLRRTWCSHTTELEGC